MLLAADVGGTKTNLGLDGEAGSPTRPEVQASYVSAEYPDLESLLESFLRTCPVPPTRASLGIAGPVIEGRVTATNLPWRVDSARISKRLGISCVEIINDIVAIAGGIPHLSSDDLFTLRAGEPVEGGPVAVVALGTGLGEAYATLHGERWIAHPSEGGHADFGPRDVVQRGLLAYLMERHDHVSYERVCSGRGLPVIYDYLRTTSIAPEPEWLRQELAALDDPTPIIAEHAQRETDGADICCLALGILVDILGAEAGNLALKIAATGGVYIAGGMAAHIRAALQQDRFLEAFAAKGRLRYVLEAVPVHVITNPEAGLVGAAAYGLDPSRLGSA